MPTAESSGPSRDLTVFLGYLPEPDHLAILKELLDPRIQLSVGEDPPKEGDFEVLVKGRPDERWMSASDQLRALVIPFAGLPDSTAEILKKFPHVRTYNLHHNALPVAEMVIGLLLSVARRITEMDRALRMDDWTPRYADNTGHMLLHGRAALILGYGSVGREVGRLCSALGMHVSAVRRTQALSDNDGILVFSLSDLPRLLPETDVLIVCLPLTSETNGLLNEDMLNRLPPQAMIVNVGRAFVFDEQALFRALVDGRIAGAGLDVWFNYPSRREERTSTAPSRFPFGSLPNVVMTPHVAGKVQGTEEMRMHHLADLLNCIATGNEPLNQIELDRGY